MNPRTPVIVGVADMALENGVVAGGGTPLSVIATCTREALDECGLTPQDLDGIGVAGPWGYPGVGQMMPLTVAEYLGLHPTYLDGTSVGGSSYELHLAKACMAIEAGYIDTMLVCHGTVQRTTAARSLGGRGAVFQAQYETPYGLPSPVGSYAMAAQRHMYEFGTTSAQLAEIATSTRKWAAMNPNAWNRDELTVQDVLDSVMICDPLHLKDCCLVTDGGGAVIITTLERARDLKKQPIFIRGYAEAADHQQICQMPRLTRSPAAVSGPKAMRMAGVTHADIDHAMIYDSFTITVLITLESLGFCKQGEGGDFVSNARTAPGGDLPMNTNGGGLSYCHPGFYGIFLLIEATRQLRGECGERQVPGAKISLCNATGGVLSSTGTVILSNQ